MKRVFSTLLGTIRGGLTTDKSRLAFSSNDRAAKDRTAARSMADAIDRAMELGLWEHADRLASCAARLAADHPRLTDRLARLRLAQGNAELALSLIEGCRQQPAAMRLLKAACLIMLGRKEEAHADLHRWSRRATAPLDARLMLALLEWEAGDHHAAIRAVARNLKHLEDPRSLQLLLLLALHDSRAEQAEKWAQRLRTCAAASPDVPNLDLLYRSLDLSPACHEVGPTDEQVNTLAMELVMAEPVIPALVEAQRRQPRRSSARLLCRALEAALPELTDQGAAFEALMSLAVLLDNHEAARGWAEMALELSPMSASVARFLQELPSPPPQAEAGRRQVLATIGRAPAEPPEIREKAA
ncbi:MAG: hypothetical protein JSV91_13780 [Phycisphaerales bacterium]|nr:MAG: hypothetical protein JSV91_13780 [Phycisphaerales bacterium]